MLHLNLTHFPNFELYLFAFPKGINARLHKFSFHRFLSFFLQEEVLHTEQGRPYLASGHFYLSLSYAEHYALLALSEDAPLGVDMISQTREVHDAIFNYVSDEEKRKWTKIDLFALKEAHLKLTARTLKQLKELSSIDSKLNLLLHWNHYTIALAFYPKRM